VPREQPVELIDDRIEVIEEVSDFGAGFRQNVVAHAADSNVIIGQPRAANLLHQIIDGLALAQGVHERRHRADVLAESPHRDQMAGQTIEFASDHAAELAAPGDFRAGQFLRR
jgi:hypothetical protein